MFKRNKSVDLAQTESIITPSDSEFSFSFQISPSHLRISHNFASSIKPKTYFQLHLIKDSHESSEINQYLNLPIHAKVFQGKIVISNVRFSFTVDCNKYFQAQNNFYLQLVQMRAHEHQEDMMIGEYQLDVDELIRNFRQRQSNYFYQECVVHPEVYLTYEVFVEKTRLRLEYLIREMRKKQKHQMKEHILRSLENNKKFIQKVAPNSEDEKQIKEVLMAHLTILNHLENDKNKNEAQSQLNYKHTKLALLEHEDQVIETSGFSLRNTGRDTLEMLSQERDMFSLKSSQIDIREQIQIPEFKGSKIRKAASLAGQMMGNSLRENESGILKNESSSWLKNQSELILIDVKLPKIRQYKSHHDSVITFNGQTQKSSELSLNNQFQQALRRMVEGERKMKGQRKQMPPLLEQFQTESLIIKKNRSTTKDVKNPHINYLSEITLNQLTHSNQTQKAKLSIFIICLIAILLCIFLIDDPSFDIFQDKHYTVLDHDYLHKKKNQPTKPNPKKPPKNNNTNKNKSNKHAK